MKALKRVAAQLPERWQLELRRYRLRRQVRSGRFGTEEPEFHLLDSLIGPGDWVIDIGANVGHYTCAMSQLVGEAGRVFALEPVPATFDLLASNVATCRFRNVTLLNVAASDRCGQAAMKIPVARSGLRNYYEARLSREAGGVQVFRLAVDQLAISGAVRLVKIDVEGHEGDALRGMWSLLERDRPALIVENSSGALVPLLQELGYTAEWLPDSPNILLRHAQHVECT